MKKYKRIIFVGIFFVGIFFLNKAFIQNKNNFLANTVSYITNPVGTTFSSAGWWLHHKTSFFRNIGTIKVKNQKLFEQNLELQSKLAKLQEVNKENDILRQELKLAPRDKYQLEPALVIGRESGNYSEIIIINKGKQAGIREGMAILVGKGVLIGRVINVFEKTTRVRLIIDKNSKINAKITESDGKGIVEGRFGTSLLMKMIPQTVEVKKGDTVITSKLSGFFQEGLLIGYIQEISNTVDELFQKAVITSPADFDKLHLVWVLK